MGKSTENAPQIEQVNIVKEEDKLLPLASVDDEPAVAPAQNTGANIKFKDLEIVKIAEMINAKNDFVSQTMIDRIEQHMQYLSDKLGFATDEARFQEQITIMETIGNSTTLSIDKYCLVTDFLLQTIRSNLDCFKEGKAFRFMRGLSRHYSDRSIANYEAYMTMLIKIAGAYADRKRAFKKMDLDSITAGLPKAARDNINTYFRRLCE